MYGLSAKKSGRSREVAVKEGLTIKPVWGKICSRDTVWSKKQMKKKIYENLPQRTTGQEKEPCLPPKETLELKKYRSMNT